MKTAVVILNWNGKQLLEQFLPSVLQYSATLADVYVADNASTDDSVAYLKSHFSEVKIIQNKENYGFAKGYNEALNYVDADVFVLLNSDVEVTKNWLQRPLDIFQSQDKVAALQPKILDYKNKTHFEYAGAAGGFIDKYGFPFCRGRLFFNIEKDEGQYDNEQHIFWASGACLFIKSKAFWEAGGFDETYFAHQEEIDLCWRLHHLGYRVFYTYQSVVYHLGGATLSTASPKKTYLNFRNSLYTLYKNVPKQRFLILFKRLSLDGLAGIHFLFQGKFLHLGAIVKAHVAFYKNVSKLNDVKSKPKITRYYFTKSIVFLFFIKKITHFSQIRRNKV